MLLIVKKKQFCIVGWVTVMLKIVVGRCEPNRIAINYKNVIYLGSIEYGVKRNGGRNTMASGSKWKELDRNTYWG